MTIYFVSEQTTEPNHRTHTAKAALSPPRCNAFLCRDVNTGVYCRLSHVHAIMLMSDDTTVLCWATLNNLNCQVVFPDPEVGISGGSVNFILQ